MPKCSLRRSWWSLRVASRARNISTVYKYKYIQAACTSTHIATRETLVCCGFCFLFPTSLPPNLNICTREHTLSVASSEQYPSCYSLYHYKTYLTLPHGPVGPFPISGKIVVVTGGGSGIGLAFVRLCSSKGAKVLIGDLKLTEDAESLVSSNPSIKFTKCNVTSWSDLKSLITTSVKEYGEVPDIYVPCAGILEPPWSNFWDDAEDARGSYATMRINVDHPIKLSRIAMTALLGADKKGVVCLVASGAGLAGFYLASLYCASKHAVVGFAKSMGTADAEEGVKVVCICPGIVATPLWTEREDTRAEAFRYGEAAMHRPEDIAECMLRLVEEERYSGGTVMQKSPGVEQVVFDLASQTITADGVVA